MRRLTILVVAAGLVVSACSSAASGSVSDGTEAPTTTESARSVDVAIPVVGLSDEMVTPGAEAITEEDLARFIASAESVLAGTAHEGVVLDAPELYIALAQASCARFSAGDSLEDIAAGLLGDSVTAPGSADSQLIGAILGAGVATICAEHANKV